MEIKEYAQLALRTTPPLSTQDKIINSCMGLTGECGELVDYFKKVIFHGKPCDRAHIVNEAGDIAFYMNWLLHTMGITWEEVMAVNIAKLKARYPDGFNKDASNNRDLEKERAAISEVV